MTEEQVKDARAVALANEANELSWRRLMQGSVLDELLDLEIDLNKVGVKGPVERGEEVLGQLDDFELHMRALSMKYGRMAGLVAVKARYDAESEEEERQLMSQADTLKEVAGSCMNLVWENIRIRLGIGPGYSIGVRDGATIVRFKNRSSGSPGEQIGKMLAKKLGGSLGVEVIGPIRDDDPEGD